MRNTMFQFQPVNPATADKLRASGGPAYVADEKPGFPCRQCLQDAEIGEEMILVSYDPFTEDSPYRCASPIFLHRQPCGAALEMEELPTQLTCRNLSVRSFDDAAMMIDAAVISGKNLSPTLSRLFDNPDSARIHIHNAERGCWATSVERVTT